MNRSQEWADLVHKKYKQVGFRLHKQGEWTIVAGIILIQDDQHRVVALGAGLKCLPEAGKLLHHKLVRDSHAETLTRRAFMAYLGHQIINVQAEGESILIYDPPTQTYKLKQGVRFGMYISQAPCGDASMHFLDPFDRVEEPVAKELKTLRGRSRVGIRGVLRTKPGRADSLPSYSHSCSDKIALWSVIGWQGAILARLIPEPIKISEFLIGERFNEEGLKVGIVDKAKQCCRIEFEIMGYTENGFEYGRASVLQMLEGDESKLIPSSVGQVWFESGGAETLVNGRRQGSARPKDGNFPLKLQSFVSTERLFELYKQASLMITKGSDCPIEDGKRQNTAYQTSKAKLFSDDNSPFNGWCQKSESMRCFRQCLSN